MYAMCVEQPPSISLQKSQNKQRYWLDIDQEMESKRFSLVEHSSRKLANKLTNHKKESNDLSPKPLYCYSPTRSHNHFIETSLFC